jgi:hypothetical protein
MTLSIDQVSLIRDYVDQNRIHIETLRDDLLDHLCCCVEEKLDAGKSFGESLREAVGELAPDGLQRLEHETLLLLNTNNIVMKKFMYFIGLLASMSMAIGMTFLLLHMPGGFQLFNYGFLTFGLVFLPMAAYNSYRLRVKRSLVEKLRIILGFLSAIVVSVAILFKLMHYPGVDPLLLTGIAIFSFGFLPCLFYSLYSKSVNFSNQS